jgi:PAS domain S-box-containing protein
MAKPKQAIKDAQLIAAVVEFSDDAIIGSTIEGVVTSWNPAAERMYGYSSKEVIGKSGSLLAPEDRTGEINTLLVSVKDGETVEKFKTTLVREDRTVVPVSLTFAPIRDEDGVIVGVCMVHRDVTEQTRAFDVAQRMEAIVESSDDAIIALTLEGIVTSWNPAAERLFGYTTDEIVGKPAETVTPKDRPDEMKNVLAKVKAGEHIDHLESIRVRKDGSVFPVSLTVSPIRDAHGAIVGTSMISRNMTELKHAVRYARSLIEAAVDPLVTISPEGKITDVNEATIKVTGCPPRRAHRDRLLAVLYRPRQGSRGLQTRVRAGVAPRLPANPDSPGRDTGRRLVQRLGLPRLQRQRPGRGRRCTRLLQAARTAAAQRPTPGGPGVTDHHRTGQGDHRTAP